MIFRLWWKQIKCDLWHFILVLWARPKRTAIWYWPIYDSSGVIVTLNVQFPSLIPHILCTCFGFCFLLTTNTDSEYLVWRGLELSSCWVSAEQCWLCSLELNHCVPAPQDSSHTGPLWCTDQAIPSPCDFLNSNKRHASDQWEYLGE